MWSDLPCKIFFGSKDKDGYGICSRNNKTISAHRAVWLDHYGWIPPEQCICHHCDVRGCIEITHLFLGTNEQNTQDRNDKERTAKGPNKNKARKGNEHGMSQLTEKDIPIIREKAAFGISQRTIARQFNVKKCVIFDVVHNITWKHVK